MMTLQIEFPARFSCQLALTILVATLLTGCQTPDLREHARIYDQQSRILASANLFKPRDHRDNEMWSALAPLIVHETTSTDLAGYLVPVDPPTNSQPNEPTAYVHESNITLHGQTHPQITYVWFYLASDSQELHARALRMTLDTSGAPVIWEILGDDDQLVQAFVAQSLESESAANTEPATHRRHHVEPPVNEHPNLIVPRILADGPVPMGPWVYLDEGRNPITVICRCMPSQLDKTIADTYYQIRPLSDVTSLVLDQPLPILNRLDRPSPLYDLRLSPIP